MTVDAAGRFWKAISYDFYTGNGWRTTETDKVERVNARARTTAVRRDLRDAGTAAELLSRSEPVRATIAHQFQTGSDRSYSIALRSVRRGADKYNGHVVNLRRGQAALRRARNLSDYIKRSTCSCRQRCRSACATSRTRWRRTGRPYDKAEVIECILRKTYRYAPTVPCTTAGRDPWTSSSSI